jgi:putative spermidine/putrescine transport system ATP-binding protein
MSYIIFEDIEKFYGTNHVLKKTNLSIEQGQFVTLLGSSGCGKSTLLRCLAGLEEVSSGKIFLDGKEITSISPKDRNVGMIFQQYSLFPNMSVYNNISFGLRMKGIEKGAINDRVKEAIKMVDLKGNENKYPSQLSGGEQQRVALARCIVTQPKVLLLDEPLSAIDAKLRKSLQLRIKEIHKELNMTSIFVTHDQDEAMTMSDTIHLMKDGIIEQSEEPLELYSNPKTSFAASFIGNYNILKAKDFAILVDQKYSKSGDIAIRPETIDISSIDFVEMEDFYQLEGKVIKMLPQGNIIRYTVSVNQISLDVDVLFNDVELYDINQIVFLRLKKSQCISL